MSAADQWRQARRAEAEVMRILRVIAEREKTDYGRTVGGVWATEVASRARLDQRAAGSKLGALHRRGLVGRKMNVEARAYVYYLRAQGHQLIADHDRFQRYADAPSPARMATT